ncbi:MAG: hypothetical protein ACTS4T_01155 [Candidatus Hodgkinia cicadicola]
MRTKTLICNSVDDLAEVWTSEVVIKRKHGRARRALGAPQS